MLPGAAAAEAFAECAGEIQQQIRLGQRLAQQFSRASDNSRHLWQSLVAYS